MHCFCHNIELIALRLVLFCDIVADVHVGELDAVSSANFSTALGKTVLRQASLVHQVLKATTGSVLAAGVVVDDLLIVLRIINFYYLLWVT